MSGLRACAVPCPETGHATGPPGRRAEPRNWEYGLKWGTLWGRADLTTLNFVHVPRDRTYPFSDAA